MREVLERIVSMSGVSSKDKGRHHLCGVHIKPIKNTLVLEATDGYKMIREEIKGQIKGLGDKGVLIPNDQIGVIKGFLKSANIFSDISAELKESNQSAELKESNQSVELRESNQSVELRGSNQSVELKESNQLLLKNNVNTFSCRVLSDVTYPDLEIVVPQRNEDSKVYKVAFNAKYLDEIWKALRRVPKDVTVTLELEFDEDNKCLKPIIVKCCEREAVLMPMRT